MHEPGSGATPGPCLGGMVGHRVPKRKSSLRNRDVFASWDERLLKRYGLVVSKFYTSICGNAQSMGFCSCCEPATLRGRPGSGIHFYT